MKEYPLWLKGEAAEDAAAAFTTRVTDVSAFLADLGARTPGPLPEPLTVAYRDACHLAHGQGVTLQPRHLLAMVPNLEPVEIPDGELCCGSAGSYNIEQPEIASELGQRKADAILASGADAVATGNIGCLIQIQTHLKRQGQSLALYHTIQGQGRSVRERLGKCLQRSQSSPYRRKGPLVLKLKEYLSKPQR
jgi:glycolate oxidase iron-sulfur subunit